MDLSLFKKTSDYLNYEGDFMEELQSLIVEKDNEKELKDLDKFINYYYLMHYWMKNIEEGKSLTPFFFDRGYKKIAVYGTGYLGLHLITQLSDEIETVYTIDKGVVRYNGKNYPISESKEIVSEADVIVVTPVTDYEQIKKMIKSSIDIDIISLEEVILSV